MTYKIIKDFPNYRINKLGQIQSCYKPKTAIPTNTWRDIKHIFDKSCGYYIVTLAHEGVRKNKRVHRLLMETFIDNPLNKVHVNHIDANKLNNALENLEWATSQENASHAANLGLYQPSIVATKREVCMYSPDKQVYLGSFNSLHEAERKTNIHWQNIWKVCDGRRHTAGGYHWKYKNV